MQSVFRKHQHTAFCTVVLWSVDSPINRPERNSITSSLFVCSKDVIQTEVNFTPLTNDCYVIPFPCSLSVSNNMVLRLREGTDRQTDTTLSHRHVSIQPKHPSEIKHNEPQNNRPRPHINLATVRMRWEQSQWPSRMQVDIGMRQRILWTWSAGVNCVTISFLACTPTNKANNQPNQLNNLPTYLLTPWSRVLLAKLTSKLCS